MSEPKALRFSRIDAEEPPPEWMRATQALPAVAVGAWAPPQVVVEDIERAADSGEDPPPAAPEPEAVAVASKPSPAPKPEVSAPAAPQPGASRAPKGDASVSLAPPAADPALEAELREATARFSDAAADLATVRHEVLAEVEGQLLELSIRVAEAIIEREVERDSALHDRLVEAALACVAGERQAELRVSQAAYEVLCEARGGAVFEHHGVSVRLVPDTAFHGLGCVVDTGRLRVDGRVAQRLLAVRRAFEAQRDREGSSG